MNKTFALSIIAAGMIGGAAVAGGTECDPHADIAAWENDAVETQTLCRIVVAADASAVAARCGGDRGASTMVLDDVIGFSLTRGSNKTGYYEAPTADFADGTLTTNIETLLETAQTCLSEEACKTGPNPPDILQLLAQIAVPLGNIQLNVANHPNGDSGGLLDRLDLGAGLGSALEDNPALALNYVMFGDIAARAWQDPAGVGGLPSFNVQVLEKAADTCQK